MPYRKEDHTFAICAYKETKYLEDCIISVLSQTQSTKVIICTSTPNEYIRKMAQTYQVPLMINHKPSGLASDWNFALSCVETPLATLCHQDDYYAPEYAEKVLEAANRCDTFLMAYTNYQEEKHGALEHDNINLRIKNLMNAPMKFHVSWDKRFIRRRILSFGNPICCPSVTFGLENIPQPIFDPAFQNAADWDAWERISKLKGSVVYCKDYLMVHRVHEGSTTTLNIQNHIRGKEDLLMFERFWPSWFAKRLAKLFKLSEKNNES